MHTTQERPPAGKVSSVPPPWSPEVCLASIRQLWALRAAMVRSEQQYADAIKRVGPQRRGSARNLVHFLALRATDLRELQARLAWLGVSSLGRAESHVLASVDKVLGILHRLTGQDWEDRSPEEPVGSVSGPALLQKHTCALLGPVARDRQVRIMVTLPGEAASDAKLVRSLVEAGMDVARINCAHDDAKAWASMARQVRKAAKAAHREIKVLMDLGGPKIRTGPLPVGPAVLKLRPARDELGFAVSPWRLRLVPLALATAEGVGPRVVLDHDWLDRLRVGQQIHLTDARGKKRRLLVVDTGPSGVVTEGMETCYLTPDTPLSVKGRHGSRVHTAYPAGIEPIPSAIRLHRGDVLYLTADPVDNAEPGDTRLPRIACTLPQVIGQVQGGRAGLARRRPDRCRGAQGFAAPA
jgi:pyruvate kinase